MNLITALTVITRDVCTEIIIGSETDTAKCQNKSTKTLKKNVDKELNDDSKKNKYIYREWNVKTLVRPEIQPCITSLKNAH